MSKRDGRDFLYLVWKSESSGKQYIVGQLVKNGQFEFQYMGDLENAMKEGFRPLLCFPDLQTVYVDEKLFPVFASRLPDRKRKDIEKILKKYGLTEYDEYMLLKRSGARLPIDNLGFIDPILDVKTNVTRIFFVAGVRHYLACQGKRCEEAPPVTRGDEVVFQKEAGNPNDKNAVQILDMDRNLLGYVPQYYSKGVSEMLENKGKVVSHIYRVDKNKNCNECLEVIMQFEA